MNEVSIPILNNEYKVIVCWGPISTTIKILNNWGYDDVEPEMFANHRGITFTRRSCHPVIVLPKFPKSASEIATFTHETVHAVSDIFEKIGETSRGEIFAHSVGAVVRQTLQITEKHVKSKNPTRQRKGI